MKGHEAKAIRNRSMLTASGSVRQKDSNDERDWPGIYKRDRKRFDLQCVRSTKCLQEGKILPAPREGIIIILDKKTREERLKPPMK